MTVWLVKIGSSLLSVGLIWGWRRLTTLAQPDRVSDRWLRDHVYQKDGY